MSTKRALSIVLVACATMLAVGIDIRAASPARALPPVQADAPIPYTGRLTDEAGQPVSDGVYDFTFTFYAAETGGEPLWMETQEAVIVQGGAFVALLGSVNGIPREALDGGDRWLEIALRGPGEANFTALAPRQRLSAAAPGAPAGPACPHDHWGETWDGASGTGLTVRSSAGTGVVGVNIATGNYAELGLHNLGMHAVAFGPGHSAVYGQSTSGDGVRGDTTAAAKSGVYGYSENGFGVTGRSTNNHGVQGFASWGVGVYAHSDHLAGVFAHSTDGVGLSVTNENGDIIRAFGHSGSSDIEFKVTNDGHVYADGQFHPGGADLAEMLPAVEGLEPGDVLVIGPDGQLARSSAAYQPTVVGVYSTQPGFVGGSGSDVDLTGKIPLSVVGVVPVKVSAENGSILPGDLLVASATPGHAMKAGPNPPLGTVIGKALEMLEAGVGVIIMLAILQ